MSDCPVCVGIPGYEIHTCGKVSGCDTELSRSPGCSTADSRKKFESWVSESPYQKSLIRYAGQGALPGQYKDYSVQLAWEAWQAARQ